MDRELDFLSHQDGGIRREVLLPCSLDFVTKGFQLLAISCGIRLQRGERGGGLSVRISTWIGKQNSERQRETVGTIFSTEEVSILFRFLSLSPSPISFDHTDGFLDLVRVSFSSSAL